MLCKNKQTKKQKNNNGSIRKSKKKFKKYLKKNDNEDTTIPNLQDAAKAVLRGKFMAIQAFLKKEEKSQIDNLTHHLSKLEKTNKT